MGVLGKEVEQVAQLDKGMVVFLVGGLIDQEVDVGGILLQAQAV